MWSSGTLTYFVMLVMQEADDEQGGLIKLLDSQAGAAAPCCCIIQMMSFGISKSLRLVARPIVSAAQKRRESPTEIHWQIILSVID